MRMGKDPADAAEDQRILGQIQSGQLQVLEAFIEKRMGVLNKQLQDEREENYRLRLKIQELEDNLKDATWVCLDCGAESYSRAEVAEHRCGTPRR